MFTIFGKKKGLIDLMFYQSIPEKNGWDLIWSAPLAPNRPIKSLFKSWQIRSLANGDIIPSSNPTSGHSKLKLEMLSTTSSIVYAQKGLVPMINS